MADQRIVEEGSGDIVSNDLELEEADINLLRIMLNTALAIISESLPIHWDSQSL